MLKFFSVGKNQVGVLITLIVLIMLGASYFFIYLPENEKTVQERHFLCLQNIDNNIHSKIDNSVTMLNNLLMDYPANTASIKNYIINYPKVHFTLLPVDIASPTDPKTKNKRALAPGEIKLTNDSAAVFNIVTDPVLPQFVLRVNREINKVESGDSLSMGIRFRFEQFIKPILPADVFDKYVVFSRNKTSASAADKSNTDKGKVVFENFPSGLSYKSRDSLLAFKNGLTSPGVRSITIGGTDYKAFSQPVNFGGDNAWIIVGLVDGKSYNTEKNALPVSVVLLLLTAAIGMIISLPWVKLYHMGNKDKLTITDGVASVLVSILMMALLFFVFFVFLNHDLYLGDGVSSKSATKLANSISKAFTNEVNTAYDKLNSFDIEYNKTGACDLINLGKNDIIGYGVDHATRKIPPDITVLDTIAKGFAVDQVYWINKDGQEINNWTSGNDFIPRTSLSSREYFKKVIGNQAYNVNGHIFYLDQVISRSSDIFTSVIAKKYNKKGIDTVAAMTFTAKSLESVILPDGFQFAIIDSTGEVLYHSLANRNLNENLKNELADSSQLISSMEAHSDTSFKAEYYGKTYQIKIKPIKNLPYFITILEDSSYNDTRDTESYAFTISMVGFLLFFLAIQFSLAFFASSKQSFFKKQLFETSWIGPKISFHKYYNLIIIINLAIISLLIYYFDLTSFLKNLFLILFSITFIGIFKDAIFALKYWISYSYNLRFKLYAVGWQLVMVLVIDYIAHRSLDTSNFWELLRYELVLTVISISLTYVCYQVSIKYRDLIDAVYKARTFLSLPWTYTHSFAMMATTRLIITSGMPVVFFYIYSFNYEQNLDTRYKQYGFARSVVNRLSTDSLKKNIISTIGTYADGSFINHIGIDTGCKDPFTNILYFDPITRAGVKQNANNNPGGKDVINPYSKEDYLTVKLLNHFRLHRNDIAVKSDNLNFPSVADQVYFNNLAHERLNTGDSVTRTYYNLAGGKYLRIVSGNNIYHISTSTVFWISFIILIGGFYYVIHNIIRKLFALKLPMQDGWREMDDKILLDNKLNSLLLIVGAPGSGKLKKLKELINQKKLTDDKGNQLKYHEEYHTGDNVYVADMINIPTGGQPESDWNKCKEYALKKSNYLVIINHFEYDIKDPHTNSVKLDFLESLMLQAKSKIMIISTVHPLTFLDSFNDEQKTASSNAAKPQDTDKADDQQKAAVPAANGITQSELERWHVLLGHFRIIIEPLKDYKPNYTDADKKRLRAIENKRYGQYTNERQSIKEETRYTHHLNDMQERALNTIPYLKKSFGLPTDSLIFKMQISAHYFYTYIWQSLTKEEKFLLYDLAEDGLVNPYDDYNLSMLIYKGLITREKGTLALFDKGFRNYILTAIGNTEVERIKAQVKDNGNWGSLRGPINLIILAILVFLLASQQEAYTKIITYVTALGAGVPAVLRIFSLLGSSKSTQKTS